jgi:hypothetical protein
MHQNIQHSKPIPGDVNCLWFKPLVSVKYGYANMIQSHYSQD